MFDYLKWLLPSFILDAIKFTSMDLLACVLHFYYLQYENNIKDVFASKIYFKIQKPTED